MGSSIQAKGIVPDLMVDETADGDGLNSLRIREMDLEKHLSDGSGKPVDPAIKARRDLLEEEQRALAVSKSHKALEFGGADDFQLAQAINHFKGLPVKLSKTEVAEDKDTSSK